MIAFRSIMAQEKVAKLLAINDYIKSRITIEAFCINHICRQNWELSRDGKPLNRINPLV